MKSLFTTTALGLVLAVSPALAQSSDQTQTPMAQPETQQKSPGSGSMNQDRDSSLPGATDTEQSQGAKPETTRDAARSETATEDTSAGTQTAAAGEGQRASELIGVAVENDQGESIGEINDILVAKQQGEATKVLIGVGGFLGLGEKTVSVDFQEVDFQETQGGVTATVAMSQEELEAMPSYTEDETGYGAEQETQTGGQQQGSPQGGATQPRNQ